MDVNSKIANLRADVTRIEALFQHLLTRIPRHSKQHRGRSDRKSQTTSFSDTNHDNFEAITLIIHEIRNIKRKIEDLAREADNPPPRTVNSAQVPLNQPHQKMTFPNLSYQ